MTNKQLIKFRKEVDKSTDGIRYYYRFVDEIRFVNNQAIFLCDKEFDKIKYKEPKRAKLIARLFLDLLIESKLNQTKKIN